MSEYRDFDIGSKVVRRMLCYTAGSLENKIDGGGGIKREKSLSAVKGPLTVIKYCKRSVFVYCVPTYTHMFICIIHNTY